MGKYLENQVDLMIQLVDDDARYISSDFLVDLESVQAFFNVLARDVLLQSRFLIKLKNQDIKTLCMNDTIPEEAIIYILSNTRFPLTKVIDFLRVLPNNSQFRILQGLVSEGYWAIDELMKHIDAKYGMIEGVFFEDDTDSDVVPTVYLKLEMGMKNASFSMDAFQHYIFSALMDETKYSLILTNFLAEYNDMFKNMNLRVSTKEEFILFLKFVYLLSVSSEVFDVYGRYVDILIQRFILTLSGYKTAKSMAVLFEQCTDLFVESILKKIIVNTSQFKDIKQRNQLVKIKQLIEEGCQLGVMPMVKKGMRRCELSF